MELKAGLSDLFNMQIIINLNNLGMKKAQKLVIDDMITMNITCGEITSIVIEVPFPCDPLCIGSSYGQQSIQYLPHFSARVYGQQNKQCKENNHTLQLWDASNRCSNSSLVARPAPFFFL